MWFQESRYSLEHTIEMFSFKYFSSMTSSPDAEAAVISSLPGALIVRVQHKLLSPNTLVLDGSVQNQDSSKFQIRQGLFSNPRSFMVFSNKVTHF